jgi:hypothetical protein
VKKVLGRTPFKRLYVCLAVHISTSGVLESQVILQVEQDGRLNMEKQQLELLAWFTVALLTYSRVGRWCSGCKGSLTDDFRFENGA